jgi:uncharacterized RDD family membrane protein YckC
VPSHSSFTADPVRRYAAFFADAVTTALLFLVVGAIGDQVHVDLGRWDVLAAVWVLYQGTTLVANDGQSFGRYLANIMVCGETGAPLDPVRAYARTLVRALPLALLEGPLGVSLVGQFAFLGLMIAESRLLESSPTRQTLADRIARSLVVNLPPPHSHRAPAGPMFSAADAEFGHPPKRPRE